MTTIDDIYAAINPLPALLNKKGKIKPNVSLVVEANARIAVSMNFVKWNATREWDCDYQTFIGDTFDEALLKATAFIGGLPSAEQAKLHDFMGQLGKLIDAGKSGGIDVDYLNPLLDTMKRLSENVITHQPPRMPQETSGPEGGK